MSTAKWQNIAGSKKFFSKAYFLVILDYKALVALLTDLTPKCYIFIDPKRLQASKWSEL